ncbi:MAG TPA: Gfo/Idh/MocA family oxidoreductase [Gemmataceae bacterium]|nr:Gfo/Idh/MocA family oxidoreductase [Gemmataceae bacterium]
MALDLTTEQRELGKANFQRTVGELADPGVNRRQFMKGLLAAGAVLPIPVAVYFGYKALQGNPVRAGLIGGGDEGGVLIGSHNKDFLDFVAVSDIRPYNQERIFRGEPTGLRLGFDRIYGKNARKKIQLYPDYKDLLKDKNVEAVVIALPLHLHAKVAIEAMEHGKHVLCEKLMAWNITQCKDMIRAAYKHDRILTIGHQRHYSMLYAQASEVLDSGILGDVKYIRALWHRNNSWPQLDADGKEKKDPVTQEPLLRDSWHPPIPPEDYKALKDRIQDLGYKSLEHLIRWRLYNATGGGLMAELGSHQLDACSIFLGKVHPLAVSGYGNKLFYHDDREVDDSVFVTFEFPGKGYYADPEHKLVNKSNKNDVVVVTYSSINTNQFENYGECVMGTRGTMVVEAEQNVMLFKEKNPNEQQAARSMSVTVSSGPAGKPALDAAGSVPTAAERSAQDKGQGAAGSGPVSRGYREEMEHFAYCIRMHDKAKGTDREQWRLTPKCHGAVAMADAIIALTANKAMRENRRIEFKPEWFDPENSAVPDADMKPAEPPV